MLACNELPVLQQCRLFSNVTLHTLKQFAGHLHGFCTISWSCASQFLSHIPAAFLHHSLLDNPACWCAVQVVGTELEVPNHPEATIRLHKARIKSLSAEMAAAQTALKDR